MATNNLSIRSERESGQVVLEGTKANVDGPQEDLWALPAGFGDCYLVRCSVVAASIATMRANPELAGVFFGLMAQATLTTQDIFGGERWHQYLTTRLLAVHLPLIAPLVRDGEGFTCTFDEVDTNASPTADLIFQVLVQRRRNMGPEPAPQVGPLQFTS